MSNLERAERVIAKCLGSSDPYFITAGQTAEALEAAGLLAPDEDVEVELVETWVGKPIYATCCGKCENECYVDYLTGERE